ncbi:MAG TPA: decaprenyl-phosphate phosphoribosyltransferase, partial [Aquella sp.]|nr:decaprenyl-phosphate phosphoribosyltransferase [Aquella sp.]
PKFQDKHLGFWLILSYIILNIFYTFKLKHVVILDVFIISLGFLLRLFSGTTGLGIINSDWLILCATMITLLLGFAKRRSELLLCENMQIDPVVRRRVLEDYEPKMLDIFISITAACSLLSYFLFIIFTNKTYLLFTAFFVVYGIFRYIFKLYKHGGGQDTANDLLDDPHLIITGAMWISLYIYLNW